jgi:prolyl 4-hydroxylase
MLVMGNFYAKVATKNFPVRYRASAGSHGGDAIRFHTHGMDDNMTQTALSSLPRDWQDWITTNIARGCDTPGMQAAMVRDGQFDDRLALAAIEEARRGSLDSAPRRIAMPAIDTTANTIRTPDRTIDVLLTLVTPRVVVFGNVLSDEECDALCAYAEPRLERSTVLAEAGASTAAPAIDDRRTSRGAMIGRGETPLVARVDARLAAIANWPVERAEGLQIQHYGVGHEYKAHFDWFDPSLPGPARQMEQGGQRLGTFVLYLNDVAQGGGTSFPGIGLAVQPKKGNALFFANTDEHGKPDRATYHAGMPVVNGVKVIANKWLRERTY